MGKQEKKKILFLVQLPPPVHGVSVMNNFVVTSEFINKSFLKKVIKLNFSKKISELRQITIQKITKTIIIFFKLLNSLIFFKPDIVFFTLFPFGKAFFLRDFFYLALIKLFNKKIILYIHNVGINNDSNYKLKRKLYNWVFSNINIVFLSEKIKEKETLNLALKKTKYFIIPNGIKEVDINKYHNNRNNKECLNILFFSNFFKEKGMFILLDVFKNLLNKHNNIKLIIAGQDFDYNKQKIEKFISDNNLSDKITIKTDVFDDDKNKLYAESDIFVFPSYFYETSSLVIMEAMQFGLPIVASATGVISDLLINNETALLFTPKNYTEFEKKLSLFINNKKLREDIGKKARKYFLQNYTFNVFSDKLSKMINSVVNE